MVDTVRDVVCFLGGSHRSLIVHGESIGDMIVLPNYVHNNLMETYKIHWPSTQLLCWLCIIHVCLKWLMIRQDGKVGSSQLSFKEFSCIDYCS